MSKKSLPTPSRTRSRSIPSKLQDSYLYLYSALAFLIFFALVLWAFWTSYYGDFFGQHQISIRLHGISMTLWCLMLISQALLIRSKRFRLHRNMGKISYVLVPFIIWSGAHLAFQTIHQAPVGSDAYYYMIALMYNSLIVFAILYALAMWHRKKGPVHARYMISTIFPLFTPVTDRLIYKYFESLIPFAPTMSGGMPMVPALGFMLADLIILVLLVWDWLKHRRLSVFPLVLGLLMLYHISVLVLYNHEFWKVIADVLMKIPVG